MPDKAAQKDFFISYNKADKSWAEWIAWVLEAEGYTTIIQAWDFRPGMDFISQMDQATQHTHRSIAVLSPNYLNAEYTHPEWHAAFHRDPPGEKAVLVLVRAIDPNFSGLLANISRIDLLESDEATARQDLLDGLKEKRVKPATVPFPGAAPAGGASTTPRPVPFPGGRPDHWLLPYARNLFFTGREDVLEQMYLFLAREQCSLLMQAITGQGGVGKSQTAIEYAYRYQHEYQAVFWVQAETRETLQGDLLKIASVLELPERNEQKQEVVVAAVRRWLETHDCWLLIFDNVEDHQIAREALPTHGQGHALLMARDPALGTLAQPLPLDVLPEEEGITFLLRCSRLATPVTPEAISAQRDEAHALVEELGTLPLALDQAGAYMAETQCSLKDYLALYQPHRKALLARRGQTADDHTDSVAATFALAFEKVKQANQAAAELVQMCAFLAPDAIPEELFTKGGETLPPSLRDAVADPLLWNDTIEALRRYALLERQPESKTLTIHRLVQVVLKDDLSTATQRRWAERAVRTANSAFPYPEFPNWDQCQRLLPHALVCASHIEKWHLAFTEAAHLLNQTGYYLLNRAQYAEALPFYERALKIDEQALGATHPDVATSLNNLAELYLDQEQYTEALPLPKQALEIKERMLGPDHPDVAQSLNNLGKFYHDQGQYAKALPLYQRALKIFEQALGPDHSKVATSLNNLAELYRDLGQYTEALPLHEQALEIKERMLGPDHPDVAASLGNLGKLYHTQGQYTKALPLYQRALKIFEQALGPDHPDVATSLNNLAMLYYEQGQYAEALPLHERALKIWEQALGPDHPDVATNLNNLAGLYYAQKQYTEALPLLQQALKIREQALGPTHPNVAESLNNLAMFYYAQKQYTEALPLLQQALKIWEQSLGPTHPNVAMSLNNLAMLYYDQRQYAKALPLLQRALAILEKTLPDHPNTIDCMQRLAVLLFMMGEILQALELITRAEAIRAKRGSS